jgi:predicted RNase H-like HicB family nuclease
MKFATVFDRDEDGIWIAECPSIPGCVSQGQTREEALANIKEAIALCLEVRAERGLPLTSPWARKRFPLARIGALC